MISDGNSGCRVCGFALEFPPWGHDNKTPLFDYCACCGVEFGYGDSSRDAAVEWRRRWIAGGYQWQEPTRQPLGWTAEQQLTGVPLEFR